MSRPAYCVVVVVALAAFSCRSRQETRPFRDPPPPDVLATVIDYVDTDGFDGLFEAALVTQDPVIAIRTDNDKPDWEGRLNAWIAAWNMGGIVEPRVIRGQMPLSNLDGDTLREFRLLVRGVVDRAEEAARAGASWWREERLRSRRVALLKPYNLRFHMGDEGRIHLIFFNGNYAGHYQHFMTALTDSGEEESWSRTVDCSFCKKMREALRTRGTSPPGV